MANDLDQNVSSPHVSLEDQEWLKRRLEATEKDRDYWRERLEATEKDRDYWRWQAEIDPNDTDIPTTILKPEQIALARTLPWFHSMALGAGFITAGHKQGRVLRYEKKKFIDCLDLRGRSVIDVGSFNGYFAIAAKKAGAARVIATDKFVWNDPVVRARESFNLAKECLNADVEAVEIDPEEFPGSLTPANVVLFLGVFYHLWNPMKILESVAALTENVLVLETHMDGLHLSEPAMIHYPGTELAADPTNWWGPNVPCVYALLRKVGFPEIVFTPGANSTPENPRRGIFYAFRSKDDVSSYFKEADRIRLETDTFNLSDDLVRDRLVQRITAMNFSNYRPTVQSHVGQSETVALAKRTKIAWNLKRFVRSVLPLK